MGSNGRLPAWICAKLPQQRPETASYWVKLFKWNCHTAASSSLTIRLAPNLSIAAANHLSLQKIHTSQNCEMWSSSKDLSICTAYIMLSRCISMYFNIALLCIYHKYYHDSWSWFAYCIDKSLYFTHLFMGLENSWLSKNTKASNWAWSRWVKAIS